MDFSKEIYREMQSRIRLSFQLLNDEVFAHYSIIRYQSYQREKQFCKNETVPIMIKRKNFSVFNSPLLAGHDFIIPRTHFLDHNNPLYLSRKRKYSDQDNPSQFIRTGRQ